MKSRFWFAALALVFLAQCGVEDAPQQDTRLEETHKEQFGNYYEFLAAGEPKVLALSGSRAKRFGATLSLELAYKKTAAFVTTCVPNSEAEDCVSFHLMAVWPSRHSYLVHKGYIEGGEYLLISDRDGSELVLEGPPVLGPDTSRFLVLTPAGGTEAGIRIYKISNGRASLEWSVDGYPIYGYDTPVMVQWVEDKISLEYRAYSSPTEHLVTGRSNIVRREGAWHLLPQD